MSKTAKKRLQAQRGTAAALASAADRPTVDIVNPFEVKVNKQKHDVMGKQRPGERGGLPAQSRLRAVKQREQTLLVEHQRKGKVSMMIDQRFGERDSQMTEEEKMLARFAKEREQRKRKSAYNLEDADDDDEGEELTHLGKSIASMDSFDDIPMSDDEEDEDGERRNRGQTDASIVSRAHFGGFDDDEGDEGVDADGRPKTKREVMRELISKSKMYKMERQVQRDEDAKIIDGLDADFGELREILGPQLKNNKKSEQEGGARNKREDEEHDEYDALLREMAKERRARPTDRLKTEEELAREEYLKLERLEVCTERMYFCFVFCDLFFVILCCFLCCFVCFFCEFLLFVYRCMFFCLSLC